MSKTISDHCKYLIINHSFNLAKKTYNNSVAMTCLHELGLDGYRLALKDLYENRTIRDMPNSKMIMNDFISSLQRNYKGLFSEKYNKEGKITKKS